MDRRSQGAPRKGEGSYAQRGLTVTHRFGSEAAQLSGWPARVYLLQKPAGTPAAANDRRRYECHWTPVHLDVVVDDLDAALAIALAAGAQAETEVRVEAWAKSSCWPIRSATGSA